MLFASDGKEVTIERLRYNLDEQNQTAEVLGMGTPNIIDVLDNSIADWDLLPAEYVFEAKLPQSANYPGLKSVKVYADRTYINILIEPDMDELPIRDWLPFQMFINTDNFDRTGGYGDFFTDANTDILLEGAVYSDDAACDYMPNVYGWIGDVGGTGWEWEDLNVYQPFCKTQHVNGFIELQMIRELIPTYVGWNDSEFGIGFAIDQNWEFVGLLPQVSPTEENPSGSAHKLQVKINNGTANINDLAIPETISYEGKNYSVTSIGGRLIEISGGMKEVKGSGAFEGCSSMTSVTIPNTVTNIGHYAFHSCSGLTSANIPNSVTNIGECAFSGCSSLSSVTIPNSVTSISSGAFDGCGSLTSVTIPNSVTSIGSEAFRECSNLTSVTIPNSVTNIGNEAFRACISLASVTLGNSVASIGMYAFQGCEPLTSVTIPSSVTFIGEKAFHYCWNLNAVYISDLVAWCNIEFIDEFANPLFVAGNLYLNNKLLTHLSIPQSITSIKNLTFAGSSLESVTIHSNVTDIGVGAFIYCENLTSVTNYATIPQDISDKYCFEAIDLNTCTLYVPEESIELYKEAEDWKDFTRIQAISDTSIDGVDLDSKQYFNMQKVIRDGQILLLREGKTYNVQGQEVR